jgi:hypothetical protein
MLDPGIPRRKRFYTKAFVRPPGLHFVPPEGDGGGTNVRHPRDSQRENPGIHPALPLPSSSGKRAA